MRSEKQIQASRINGARSRGPITEQGKRISSRNSIRHGLLAKTVASKEDRGRFVKLLLAFMKEYQPRTPFQVSLVENMAVARWRQMRVWGVQKTAMDRDMARQDPSIGSASVRALLALRGSPESFCLPGVLQRYDTAFDRQFLRALTRLLALQSPTADRPPPPLTLALRAPRSGKKKNIALQKEPG